MTAGDHKQFHIALFRTVRGIMTWEFRGHEDEWPIKDENNLAVLQESGVEIVHIFNSINLCHLLIDMWCSEHFLKV